MRVYLANKLLSGFSVALSLSLFVTCIWTLVSLLLSDTAPKKCSTDVLQKYDIPDPEAISLCNETLSILSSPPLEDESQSDKLNPNHPNYTEAVVIDSASSRSMFEKYLFEFYEMEPIFRTFAIICLSGIILSSLIQIISSFTLIFSPHYKVSSRSRRIVIVLFVIFILYLIGFSWPIAYKRVKDGEDEDMLHTLSTLNSSIMDFCNDFQWNKLIKDLNLYYLLLFCNIIFLFFYMVLMCCLLRFVRYNTEYDI